MVVGANQFVRARLGDGQLRFSIVRPHRRSRRGERLCRQHQLVAEAHFPRPLRSSRDGFGVGGVVGLHQAKALLVAHGPPCGRHKAPMHERVATKKRGHDVACVREPEVAVEVHFQRLRVGVPHHTERKVLAVFDVGQHAVRLHRAFHVVKNGPVAGQRDVVEPRVAHVGVLPRVHLHRQRRVEWAIFVPNGPSCGSDDVVAHAEGLKDKDNAVRAVRVCGPKIHREFEVEVSFQVELTVVPCAAPLVLRGVGQANAPRRLLDRTLHQAPLRAGPARAKHAREEQTTGDENAHQGVVVSKSSARSDARACLSHAARKDLWGAGVGSWSQASI